ncbi:hypothetical protein S225a_11890 [Candidatus Brocadiaceae bacterium S225]|uniref:Uncharacterized protein n=1 Tax=Candidatus Scalindua brodae TaxID=237368 RepID=A0A0B0EIE2_9BACT|nr:MAG: hypothetical protein SCABRO_02445 [Candidatus Scalindua brodae]TWU34831.1 hypothetical protein S225a_11890 [Candidatus Brocadiaceae bacterium S225]
MRIADIEIVAAFDIVHPAFGGANAGVEEQRFDRLSRGEQIIGADNIFNVLLNSGNIQSDLSKMRILHVYMKFLITAAGKDVQA